MKGAFRKPTAQEKTLKVLIYGPPKTGKSHFAYTATQAGTVLWQDTEHGSDYYDPKSGHGFKVAYDRSPATAIEAISIANGVVSKGDGNARPIVVIDSASSVWYNQQEVAERAGGNERATFRAWGVAKKPLKKLYDEIMLSRCHVIVTARSKMRYAVSKSGEPEELGIGPDIEKGLPYAVDIVLMTGVDGTGFYAIVEGSRSPQLPTGSRIDDPKFTDLLDAMLPGEAPVQVASDVEEQLDQVEMAWEELQVWIKDHGWDVGECHKVLLEKFGRPYKPEKAAEYKEHLEGFYKAPASAPPIPGAKPVEYKGPPPL